MAATKITLTKDTGRKIRFNLAGFVLFSVSLVTASALTTHLLATWPSREKSGPATTLVPPPTLTHQAWGDLVTRDIELEMPKEYMATQADANFNQTPNWVFAGLQPAQARQLMLACGLTAAQIDRALSPQLTKVTATGTVVSPDATLVLSLTPTTRSKFYAELAKFEGNQYMRVPAFFPKNSFETLVGKSELSSIAQSIVKKLLYPRGTVFCFSDIEMALRLMPTEAERTRFMQILSHHPAVLTGLQINPDTDIEKLLAYWDTVPEAKVRNLRPVLEGLKKSPGGGNLSISYLLPPFARQRLFTFPMPPEAGDARMDCHWSTLSFMSDTLTNPLNDPYYYTQEFLTKHFNQVEKPAKYGDMIVLVGSNQKTLHSAIYLANDICFTKNGDNHMQPWTLMRLEDIMSIYRLDESIKVLTFRRKDATPLFAANQAGRKP